MSRKVTLTDVARSAGVSIATVDRVVNHRGSVTPELEEKVLRAARLLGLDRRLDYAHRQIKRVAVMIQPPANPFHAELRAGIEAARMIFAPLNIQMHVVHINPGTPGVTAKKARALRGTADGLIICTSETPEIAAAIREIHETVPVVTLATDVEDCGRRAFIGPNDARSGRVAGDLLGLFMGPRGGKVMIVAGQLDNAGHRARIRGCSDVLARRHPHCAVSNVFETDEDLAMAADHVYRALKRDPEIRGIYHLSVGSSEIVRALESQGRAGDVFVVTHDLTSNRRRLLRSRQVHAVLDQHPHLEARLAVETMARILGRLDGPVESTEIDVQIFLAENA